MNRFQKLFLAFLVKTLNITETEAAALVKSDENITDDEAISDAITKFKDHLKEFGTKKFDQGISKERAEGLTKYENELVEHFGIDAQGKKGKELVQAIIDAKATAKGEGTKLTDEQVLAMVKKHAAYIEVENKTKEIATQKDKEWQEKLNAKDKEYARKETFGTVSKHFNSLLDKNSFVFSKEAARAQFQKDSFLKEFESDNFEVVKLSDGKTQIIVLDKDGKPLENEMGHKVSVDDYFLSKADQRFDRATAKERQSPPPASSGKGKEGEQGQGQQKYTGKIPKDQNELHTMMAKATDAKERLAIREAFEGAQGAAA